MAVFHSQSEEDFPGDEFHFGSFRLVGKTEARQSFLQLVDELDETSVIVTDRGKKTAVILSFKQYELLLAILKNLSPGASQNPLTGLISKIGDLEESRHKVNKLFNQSVKKTSESI